ncbi:MAG: hypothetical protein CUN56_03905 [Phototrophicales bacterium]|nr:MAG: hypothetical protein CUN56_03905 [Phototrophicales bacterium]RMG77762.1 MAG: glycosyltransferase WbuB [Chloroflexota bacterium]
MRILLITHYFEPDGGAAAHRLTRLARLLHQHGHEITVLTTLPHYPAGQIHPDYRGRLVVKENRDGIQVIQVWLWATDSPKISRKLISQLSFMLMAGIRGIALKRPDVILIEAQPTFTSLAGVWIAALKRRAYVLNVSDLWPDHLLSVGALTETSLIYRVARRIVDFTYRHAKKIVVLSPKWGEAIARYIGQSEKIELIYNGIDLQTFHPELDANRFKAAHGIDPHKRIVSFIGTFATQYDMQTMFKVVDAFRQRDDVVFVFGGVGSQQAVFDAWYQTATNAHYTGWIPTDDIPFAWAASDIAFFAMRDNPLYQGTVPAKLFEIFAMGVPIVAAIEGVTAEIIRESAGGICVACGDAPAMVKAIDNLLADDTRRAQYAHHARHYAEQHFNIERVVAAYLRVLSS